MDDKRQESQKTVVAFVAGLLIGGLLVWVFTASPETNEPQANGNTNDTVEDAVDFVDGDETDEGDETDTTDEDTNTTNESTDTDSTPSETTAPTTPVTGSFDFSVDDQAAGTTVLLGDSVQYPTVEGWIVVHETVNGELGNALGAARYNTEAGLAPDRVQLLRGTIAGNTYRVVYYTENGDRVFDLREDVPMTTEGGARIETTFVAE